MARRAPTSHVIATDGRPVTLAGMEHAHPRRWLTLTVLCLSLLIVVMDNTIVNVTLPTLVSALHASDRDLQWIVDGYTLVFAGLLLTAGSLGSASAARPPSRPGWWSSAPARRPPPGPAAPAP